MTIDQATHAITVALGTASISTTRDLATALDALGLLSQSHADLEGRLAAMGVATEMLHRELTTALARLDALIPALDRTILAQTTPLEARLDAIERELNRLRLHVDNLRDQRLASPYSQRLAATQPPGSTPAPTERWPHQPPQSAAGIDPQHPLARSQQAGIAAVDWHQQPAGQTAVDLDWATKRTRP